MRRSLELLVRFFASGTNTELFPSRRIKASRCAGGFVVLKVAACHVRQNPRLVKGIACTMPAFKLLGYGPLRQYADSEARLTISTIASVNRHT